ncbi:hypothetical protein [Streptosporangium jomthongense]|uniref:Uncharacterized protein n=1 Tax=Streptosporangium jomthongense TaxID=1193683 RepID=A0ABV8FCA1_9ACTN
MSRATYDRTAANWARVVQAVREAGGEAVTMPVLHLALIGHGYQQLHAERAAALALLEMWERRGVLLPADVAEMRHALGEGEEGR